MTEQEYKEKYGNMAWCKEKARAYQFMYNYVNKEKISNQLKDRYYRNFSKSCIYGLRARFVNESKVFTTDDLDYIKSEFTEIDKQYIAQTFNNN